MLSGKNGELINDMLYRQYDVIYGSWPNEYNEIVIVEIGGTVHDYEAGVYLQGVRQLISEVGQENVFVLQQYFH